MAMSSAFLLQSVPDVCDKGGISCTTTEDLIHSSIANCFSTKYKNLSLHSLFFLSRCPSDISLSLCLRMKELFSKSKKFLRNESLRIYGIAKRDEC